MDVQTEKMQVHESGTRRNHAKNDSGIAERKGVGEMIKAYCDRCGKEVGEFEACTILIQGPEIRSWLDNYLYERNNYQICKDCIEDVCNFIMGKKTEKE